MRGFNDITFWWSQSSLWVLLRCPRDNQYQMNFRRLCWRQMIFFLIFRIDFFLMYCIFLSLTQKYTALLSWVLVLVTDKLWPMFLSTFKNSNMAALLCFSMPLNGKVAQHTFLSFCHLYWWLFSFFLPDEFVLKNLMKNIWAKPRFPAIMALLCL